MRIFQKKVKITESRRAFTLIEMSIVILIASILITGLLSASVSSVNTGKVKITNDRIKVIYQAIGNFVAINRRMPCPASLADAKSLAATNGYGEEVVDSGACDTTDAGVFADSGDLLVFGMVPVKTLGLPLDMAEDGFGSKIVYVINKNFAVEEVGTVGPPAYYITFSTKSFSTGIHDRVVDDATADSSLSLITINERRGGSDVTVADADETNGAILALISYGANKNGAYNSNSTTANAENTDSNSKERDNDLISTIDDVIYSVSDSEDDFDDIVFYKTSANFISDFDLMFLMPCWNAPGNGFSATTDHTYYGEVLTGDSCTSPSGTTATVRCGAHGVWYTIADCDP